MSSKSSSSATNPNNFESGASESQPSSSQQQRDTMSANTMSQLFSTSENFDVVDDDGVDDDDLQVLPPSAQNEDVDFPFLFWDMDDSAVSSGATSSFSSRGGNCNMFSGNFNSALIPNLGMDANNNNNNGGNQILNSENLLQQSLKQDPSLQQQQQQQIASSSSNNNNGLGFQTGGINPSAQNFLNEVANQIAANFPQINTGNFPFGLTNQQQGMDGSSSSSSNKQQGSMTGGASGSAGGNYQQPSASSHVWNPLKNNGNNNSVQQQQQQQQKQQQQFMNTVAILPKVGTASDPSDQTNLNNNNNSHVQQQQQQLNPFLNALNQQQIPQIMNNLAFNQQQQQPQQQTIQSVMGNKNQQDQLQSLQVLQQMQPQQQQPQSMLYGQNNLMLPPQQQYQLAVQGSQSNSNNNMNIQNSNKTYLHSQLTSNTPHQSISPSKRKRQLDSDKRSTTTTTTSSSSRSKVNVVSSSDTDGEANATIKRSRNVRVAHPSSHEGGGNTLTSGSEPGSSALTTISSYADSKIKVDCDELSNKPEDEMTEEEKQQANRRRNREHARNTRARKKAYLESLKTTLDELCRERDTLVSERAGAASLLLEMQKTRTDVLLSFFALRSSYEKKRAIWSSILDESIVCVMPVTPYRSFPSSEVQISKCQRNVMGIDGMIADAASLHVLMNSLVDRSKHPTGVVQFRYTLIAEDAVVSGNQMMARWSMTSLNAVSLGATKEIRKSGMLCARFNSAHKIVALELMFDVMAFMLQLKQSTSAKSFAMVPNTVQTCVGPFGNTPMVITLAERPYTITQVNSAWEEMTGWTADEVVMKKSCKILQGEKTEQSATESLMSNIRFQRPALAAFTNYDKHGCLLRNFINIFPLSTDSKITHYVGFTVHYEKSGATKPEGVISTKTGM